MHTMNAHTRAHTFVCAYIHTAYAQVHNSTHILHTHIRTNTCTHTCTLYSLNANTHARILTHTQTQLFHSTYKSTCILNRFLLESAPKHIPDQYISHFVFYEKRIRVTCASTRDRCTRNTHAYARVLKSDQRSNIRFSHP